MKIISNFKDYYDKMLDVFVTDPDVVYVRKSQKKDQDKWIDFRDKKHTMKGYNINAFAINGRIYVCCVIDDKFVPLDDIENIFKTDYDKFTRFSFSREQKLFPYHGTKTKINEQFNCPVILLSYWHVPHDYSNTKGLEFEAKILNPNLTFYKFLNVLSNEEIFVEITNFLTKEKPFVDTRTDLDKVISNGFDKKTSFRKM